MLNPKSNYALNKKDRDAIVYPGDGDIPIRLTREDFDTEKDFQTWKAWSDANYHAEEKADHIYANHNFPLDAAEGESVSTPSPEIAIERHFDMLENQRYSAETVVHIRGQLTEKQFRRIWMYCVDGLTEREIAEAENVDQRSISVSITSALKKIRRYFKFRQNSVK